MHNETLFSWNRSKILTQKYHYELLKKRNSFTYLRGTISDASNVWQMVFRIGMQQRLRIN